MKPSIGTLKTNVDAPLLEEEGPYYYCFVVRDYEGNLVEAYQHCRTGKLTPNSVKL